MYIRTDDASNVVEVIAIGSMPTENGYELEDIDDDILCNIFQYKYIDGQFILNQDYRQSKIEQVRTTKINNLKSICNSMITKGIDVNGKHYSLTSDDQINLMKLESIATLSPTTPLLYHADGELCRPYTGDEIKAIAQKATMWISYHTTFFNFVKNQILTMSNVEDIISIQYGSTLQEPYETQLQQITQGLITVEIVNDMYDYNMLYPTVDVDMIRSAEKQQRMSDAELLDMLQDEISEQQIPIPNMEGGVTV